MSIVTFVDNKPVEIADKSVQPDWVVNDNTKKDFIKNKPITALISSYDENASYKDGDVIYKENGGYYRMVDGEWQLIIVPRLDIELQSITSEELNSITNKIILQFDRDIDQFIDLQNIKLGGELLVDQVRWLGNGKYEVDISNVVKNDEIDVYFKKKNSGET